MRKCAYRAAEHIGKHLRAVSSVTGVHGACVADAGSAVRLVAVCEETAFATSPNTGVSRAAPTASRHRERCTGRVIWEPVRPCQTATHCESS